MGGGGGGGGGEDKIVNYFDINILKGIHVYKGRE